MLTGQQDPYAAARGRMVEEQLRPRGIVSKKVLDVMREMPRHLFISKEHRDEAYDDGALPSLEGQTISQPYMVAAMTQELRLEPGQRVLELGTGTGYQTAILGRLVAGDGGSVWTIERAAALTALAQRMLGALAITNVHYAVGDGTAGWPAELWDRAGLVEFDRILVTAGAPDIPDPLLRQLADGGMMVVPLGGREIQTLTRVEKSQGHLRKTALFDCRFVPLVGEYGWGNGV